MFLDWAHRQYILKGLREIQSKTCIRFLPRTRNTTDFIFVTVSEIVCGWVASNENIFFFFREILMDVFRLSVVKVVSKYSIWLLVNWRLAASD